MRLLPILALLCACAPESADRPAAEAVPRDTATAAAADPGDAGELPPPPPPPPPAPAALPGLLPLSEAQVIAALGTGASCSLAEGGAPLMVAVPGRAVVNDNGRLVLLEADAKSWAELREGGSFEGKEVAVTVDAGAETAREGETVTRDTSTAIRRGRRSFSTSHGPGWTCGA